MWSQRSLSGAIAGRLGDRARNPVVSIPAGCLTLRRLPANSNNWNKDAHHLWLKPSMCRVFNKCFSHLIVTAGLWPKYQCLQFICKETEAHNVKPWTQGHTVELALEARLVWLQRQALMGSPMMSPSSGKALESWAEAQATRTIEFSARSFSFNWRVWVFWFGVNFLLFRILFLPP